MEQKTNAEILGIPTAKDLNELYNKLLPWEQAKIGCELGIDFSTFTGEEILAHFGLDPMDYVDKDDVRREFEDDIISEADTDVLYDELVSSWRIHWLSFNDIFYLLKEKYEKSINITDDEIKRLEFFVNDLRTRYNKKEKKDE